MKFYKRSPLIKADLLDIWLYGAEKWGVAQADKYHNNFYDAFENLASGDIRGKQDLDILIEEDVCRYKCGSHDIIYQIRPEYMYIVRILHQSMDYSLHL